MLCLSDSLKSTRNVCIWCVQLIMPVMRNLKSDLVVLSMAVWQSCEWQGRRFGLGRITAVSQSSKGTGDGLKDPILK